ncbi:MAG: DUF3106 domain-containing protein [Pseudomonadota bacterium]
MLFLLGTLSQPFTGRTVRRFASARASAIVLCCVAAFSSVLAVAQTKTAIAPSASIEKPGRVTTSRPLWKELSPSQQQALFPLAAHWDSLSSGHKRKWLALSRNHSKLSPGEQTKLHSRMSDWAGLSQQERAQARFNFDEAKQIPSDERKAKWEAYQALSETERRALAERATAPRASGATATARPVPVQKLAPVPTSAVKTQHSPRIELAPAADFESVPTPAAAESSTTATIIAPLTTAAPVPVRTPPVPVTEQPSSAP